MKTAIITLDIMNEICHCEGKIARYADRISQSNLIQSINEITAWGRKNQGLIIHVRVGFHAHYHESSQSSPVFSMKQDVISQDNAIIDQVAILSWVCMSKI